MSRARIEECHDACGSSGGNDDQDAVGDGGRSGVASAPGMMRGFAIPEQPNGVKGRSCESAT